MTSWEYADEPAETIQEGPRAVLAEIDYCYPLSYRQPDPAPTSLLVAAALLGALTVVGIWGLATRLIRRARQIR